MTDTIVVAWSPDRYGAAAARHAVTEARLRDASLVLVNATRGDAYVDEGFARGDQVSDLADELTAAGIGYELRQSMGEDIAEEVLRVASEVSASLVIVGVRRRTPVGKLLMGSVAQHVILGAACPVLAVKP